MCSNRIGVTAMLLAVKLEETVTDGNTTLLRMSRYFLASILLFYFDAKCFPYRYNGEGRSSEEMFRVMRGLCLF